MESRKRAPSPEPISEVERSNHVGRAEDVKRQKRDSASPAPTSKESWNRSIPVVPEEIGRRRPLELGGGSIGVERHALDARGEVTAVLPPGIVFFLSILPEVAAFNGIFSLLTRKCITEV